MGHRCRVGQAVVQSHQIGPRQIVVGPCPTLRASRGPVMWREWIARSMVGQEELHLVLIEYLPATLKSGEPVCELRVNRHHLSADRQQISFMTFADLEQAHRYCLKEYGVAPGDWMDEIAIPRHVSVRLHREQPGTATAISRLVSRTRRYSSGFAR